MPPSPTTTPVFGPLPQKWEITGDRATPIEILVGEEGEEIYTSIYNIMGLVLKIIYKEQLTWMGVVREGFLE